MPFCTAAVLQLCAAGHHMPGPCSAAATCRTSPRRPAPASHLPTDVLCSSVPQHGYKGIWLKVPADRAHFVGHAVDRGFEFHHAEKVCCMLPGCKGFQPCMP